MVIPSEKLINRAETIRTLTGQVIMPRKKTNTNEFGNRGPSRQDRQSLQERDDPSDSEGVSKGPPSRTSGTGNEDHKHPHDADLLRLVFESATDFAIFVEDNSGIVISW